MIDIEELKKLAEAADPGPWKASRCYIDSETGNFHIYDEGGHSEADAAYIAAANPQTVLELVQQNESLQADNAALKHDNERALSAASAEASYAEQLLARLEEARKLLERTASYIEGSKTKRDGNIMTTGDQLAMDIRANVHVLELGKRLAEYRALDWESLIKDAADEVPSPFDNPMPPGTYTWK